MDAELTMSGDSDSADGQSPTESQHAVRARRDWTDEQLAHGGLSKTRKQQLARDLTREDIEQLFGMSLEEAARVVGLGRTSFKQVCRREGIQAWPIMHVSHIAATRTVPGPSAPQAVRQPKPTGNCNPADDQPSELAASHTSPRRRKRDDASISQEYSELYSRLPAVPTIANLSAEFSDRECKQIMSRNGIPSTPWSSVEKRYVELSKTGKIKSLIAAYQSLVPPDSSPNPRAKQAKPAKPAKQAKQAKPEPQSTADVAGPPSQPAAARALGAPKQPATRAVGAPPRRITVLVHRRDKAHKLKAVNQTQPQPEATRSGRIRRARGIFDNSASQLPPQSRGEMKLTKSISRGTLAVQKNWLAHSSKEPASIVTRYEEHQALALRPPLLPQTKYSWLAPHFKPSFWEAAAKPLEAQFDEEFGPCKHGVRKTRCKACGGAYFNAGTDDCNHAVDDSYPEWYTEMRAQWKQIRSRRPSKKRRAALEAKCKRKKCPGCDDCRQHSSILTRLAQKINAPDEEGKVAKRRRALTRDQTNVATQIIRPYWDTKTGKASWDSDENGAEDLVQLINDQLDAEDLAADYTLQNLRSWKKNAHYKWTCLQNQRIPPSWNTRGTKSARLDPNDMTSWAKRDANKSSRKPKGRRYNGSKQSSHDTVESCLACQGVQRAHTCEPWARSAPWDDKLVQDSPRKRRAPVAHKSTKGSKPKDTKSKQGKCDGQRKRQRSNSSKPYEPRHTETVMTVDYTGATRFVVATRKPLSAGAAKHAARKFAAITEANCLSEKTVPRRLTPPIRKSKGSRELVKPSGPATIPPTIRCKCRKSKCLKMYCECFANRVLCNAFCKCDPCHNATETEEVLKLRPPVPRQQLLEDEGGCNCSKSRCLKKYCACFRTGHSCQTICTCFDCRNPHGGRPLFGAAPPADRPIKLLAATTVGPGTVGVPAAVQQQAQVPHDSQEGAGAVPARAPAPEPAPEPAPARAPAPAACLIVPIDSLTANPSMQSVLQPQVMSESDANCMSASGASTAADISASQVECSLRLATVKYSGDTVKEEQLHFAGQGHTGTSAQVKGKSEPMDEQEGVWAQSISAKIAAQIASSPGGTANAAAMMRAAGAAAAAAAAAALTPSPDVKGISSESSSPIGNMLYAQTWLNGGAAMAQSSWVAQNAAAAAGATAAAGSGLGLS